MQLPACGRAHSSSTCAQGSFHFHFPNPLLVDECDDETRHRFGHTLWLAVDAVSGRCPFCQRTERNRGRRQGQTIQNLGTTVEVTSPRLTYRPKRGRLGETTAMVGKPEVWADGRIDKLLRRSHRAHTGSAAWCVPLSLIGMGWCGLDPIGRRGLVVVVVATV
jgi:hypothetical protein